MDRATKQLIAMKFILLALIAIYITRAISGYLKTEEYQITTAYVEKHDVENMLSIILVLCSGFNTLSL